MRIITLIAVLAIAAIPANAQFIDVTTSSGLNHVFNFGDFHFGGGAAIIDYDNDGFEDIYIVGGTNPDVFYHNNGDGTFTDIISTAGFARTDSLLTMGVIAGDVDNDGFRDLYITTRCYTNNLDKWAPNLLYLNNGDGTFTDISTSAGMQFDTAFSTSATFADYNLDGYIDIYVLNFLGAPVYDLIDPVTTKFGPIKVGSPNYMYLNNGDLTFTEVAQTVNVVDSGCGWATVFSDYDNDNDPDLFIASDFGPRVKPNSLHQNQYPMNSFTSVGAAANVDIAVNAMGVAVGDYNEDQIFDYYITDLNDNYLFEGTPSGVFNDVTLATGVADSGWTISGSFHSSIGWGANFFDYDHDTYLDLFVCNGSLNPMVPLTTLDTFVNYNSMFKNNGNGTFTDVSVAEDLDEPNRGRGSVNFDFDNDGDQDLLVINQDHYPGYGIGTHPGVVLYRNDYGTNGNHWLEVKLQGDTVNRDAIGAKVYAHFAGRTLIREIDGGSSHCSHNTTIVHFGLGANTELDSLEVIWPGGKIKTLYDVNVDQRINVQEADSIPSGIQSSKYDFDISVFPNPFKGTFTIGNSNQQLEPGNWTFEMYDLAGRLVLQRDNIQGGEVIEWLEKGIYNYKLKKDGQLMQSAKLIAL